MRAPRWHPYPQLSLHFFVSSFNGRGNLLGKILAPLGFTDEGTEVERSKPLAWGYIASERQS